MGKRHEPAPLVRPSMLVDKEPMGRRTFVRAAGGILVVGLTEGCKNTLAVNPEWPNAAKSLISVSAKSIKVGGTSRLMLQAKDAVGSNLTVGGATVVFTASGGTARGTISATTDNGNGTYDAVYTGQAAGTAQTVGATVNAQTVSSTSTIAVTASSQAQPDPTKCTVVASPTAIQPGGSSTLTLQAKDSAGSNLTTGGATVVFTASGGTARGNISATTDNGDGTYTAVYTATAAGTAQTIAATINGAAVTTAMPTITVAAAAVPDPTKCVVTASPSSIGIGGTSTLKLQAKDAAGANITVGGATVVFAATGGSSAGTISATTDHGDGTYTGIYTATAAGSAQTIAATINGSAVTTPLPAVTVTAGFAAPDLLNNNSFETGWDGWNNKAGGDPTGIVRQTNYAYSGSYGLDYSWAANASDSGATFFSPHWSGQDRIWARFWFYLVSGWSITSIQKFWIFQGSTQLGGWELNNAYGFCFSFYKEAQAHQRPIIARASIPVDGWHSLEMDYWRNGDTALGSDLPSVAFWLDGNQITQPDGIDTFDSARFQWLNGRMYPQGGRGSSAQITYSHAVGTRNGGNTGSGTIYLDRMAVSSLGRIGP